MYSCVYSNDLPSQPEKFFEHISLQAPYNTYWDHSRPLELTNSSFYLPSWDNNLISMYHRSFSENEDI